MSNPSTELFEYDIALSFASADRTRAEELTHLLTSKDINVFQDEYRPESTWGKDIVDHLVNLFARKARYCVLLISQHYPLRKWTEEERRAAQERAFRDAGEYIIPVLVDDTDIPGLTGPLSLEERSMGQIAEQLEHRLAQTKRPAGPPSNSHDLRSGNVPSTKPDSG